MVILRASGLAAQSVSKKAPNVCVHSKRNQKTSAPERADRNFFTLYPDPVGMRTDQKPLSEHLQIRDLLQKPKAHGGSSFSGHGVNILLCSGRKISSRCYTSLREKKWWCPLLHRALDGNRYKYKSLCVIVQQCSPKSRAAAEKSTRMAGGGMVRYPLSADAGGGGGEQQTVGDSSSKMRRAKQ